METSSQAPQASIHYDAKYFEWQKELGRLGGWANVDKYRKTVTLTDRVLDFGCGGGFLLAQLQCAARYGIEPNATARETAAANGATVFPNSAAALAALGPESIDVLISDNALEHALEPWRELVALRPLVKCGGRIHFVVPCENISWSYKADDINQHLYSWSPQSLGNLLKAAGYEVEAVRPYIHKWPPRVAARVWGRIDRRWFQVEVIGRRPQDDHG
jgi:SAM-dependent methyltransferase